MNFQKNTKISIDKRKLETLLRLGCQESIIWEYIKTGELKLTGDSLIDDNLETLIDIKVFDNWGGKRKGAGRKSQKTLKKNQLEIQDDNQLENQDVIQVVDKDIDIDNNININNNNNINNNIKEKNNIKKEKFEKPEEWEVADEYLVKTGCVKSEDECNKFAQRFVAYYDSVGWKVGKNPMKDWRACVRTWIMKETK